MDIGPEHDPIVVEPLRDPFARPPEIPEPEREPAAPPPPPVPEPAPAT